MPLIPKPKYNQIFASQAPSIDNPAEFNNYPQGWNDARNNNGKPTIKQFNYLQQTSDLKALWILQNGACLPYDETIDYTIGAPVLLDGIIQYKTADGFSPVNKETPYTLKYFVSGIQYPLNAEIMPSSVFNILSFCGASSEKVCVVPPAATSTVRLRPLKSMASPATYSPLCNTLFAASRIS